VWGSQYERVTMGSVSLRTLETLSEATGNYRVEPSCTDTGSWLIALDGKVGSLESPRSKGLEEALRVIVRPQTAETWYGRPLIVSLGDPQPQSYMAALWSALG
jgi:hypothetical protein